MAGGGVTGTVVGIAHIIMTGVGLIMRLFLFFILMSIRVGECTTGSIIGTDTRGTMNVFLNNDFNRTGRPGIMIDIGKGKEPGVSGAINPDRSNRYRN
jgi:hypothetical protein